MTNQKTLTEKGEPRSMTTREEFTLYRLGARMIADAWRSAERHTTARERLHICYAALRRWAKDMGINKGEDPSFLLIPALTVETQFTDEQTGISYPDKQSWLRNMAALSVQEASMSVYWWAEPARPTEPASPYFETFAEAEAWATLNLRPNQKNAAFVLMSNDTEEEG